MDRKDQAVGGFFELDEGKGSTPLPNGTLLNTGRNALRHIIRKLGVKHIHVPFYICPAVLDALCMEGCKTELYSIGDDMLPCRSFPKEDFVLYVNYFGVCGNKVNLLHSKYPNLIVDCAQAYFAIPKGRASFSSPRKFFGIPDGGVAYGVESTSYDVDSSDYRKKHLLERKERGATPLGYKLFREAEDSLDGAALMEMSQFTRNCLQKVDIVHAKTRRLENFTFLSDHLPTLFPFDMAEDDVPMVYPYITDNPHLREWLISNKIYVATYWPGICHCDELRNRILPLPIDQRYDIKDMDRIVFLTKHVECQTSCEAGRGL